MPRALLLSLCLGLCALAQETATLRYNFQPGSELRVEQSQTTTQSQSLQGETYESELSQTSTLLWQVREVAEDGTAALSQTIERIVAEGTSVYGDERYDSADPESTPGLMTESLAATAGLALDFTVGARGALTITGGLDKAREALEGSSEALASQLESMIERSIPGLPEEAIAVGHSWTRADDTPLPDIGILTLTTTYTFEGVEEVHGRTCWKLGIALGASVENTPGGAATAGVTLHRGEGLVWIDVAEGFPIAGSSTTDMEMTITIKATTGAKVMTTRNLTVGSARPVDTD